MKTTLAIVPPIFITIIGIYIFSAVQFKPNQQTTADRIKANGYAVEEHTVQTLDGYILTLVRMPFSNGHSRNSSSNATTKPIAYLQHGMFSSSDTWILTAPEVTLAYQLVDAGYDVWLGNSRGNRYAKQHAQLAVDSKTFWQFSFHEVGIYDMRAIIDYILEHTEQKSLHFVSDSQGSTAFFVLLSEQPQYNAIFKTAHHLGPAVLVENIRTPFAKFAHLIDQTYFGQFLSNREFLSNGPWWIWVCHKTCNANSMLHSLCNAGLSLTGGEWHFNETLIPLLCETHPAGASTNQLIHYAQLYNARKFQRFDYGSTINMHYYNRTTPPLYDLAKVTACSTLYYGESDLAADGKDIENLARILHCAQAYKVPQSNWNHFDYVWGDRAKELLNDRIIADMQHYEKSKCQIDEVKS